MLERLVGHNPHLLLKVYSISHNEIEMQTQRGISPTMMEYLTEVLGPLHREIIVTYLSNDNVDERINRAAEDQFWGDRVGRIGRTCVEYCCADLRLTLNAG